MNSLSETLKSNLSSLEDTDPRWIQFIVDHRSVLLKESVKVNISPNMMNSMKYRPSDLLRELGIPPIMTWIVKLVNQIQLDSSWVDLSYLLIPNLTTINTLRSKYEQVVNEINALS